MDKDLRKSRRLGKIIDSKDLLMISLSKFYSSKLNINKIIPLIEQRSDISLRLVDWFVTNFSKKNNTVITKQKNGNIIHFNVYLSYRNQLKAYSKEKFDPFRRNEHIVFFYDIDKSIETTHGQLNFFRWILQNDILEYIKENVKEIELDMLTTQKQNQNKKKDDDNMRVKTIQTDNGIIIQKRKKRSQLSKSSIKNMNQLSGNMTIRFD
jgi:ribosomal protein L22